MRGNGLGGLATGLTLGLAIGALACTGGCESTGPSAKALGIYGDRELEAGNYARAAENYEQYVEKRPLDPDGHYKLALAYLGDERPALARESFFRGLELRNDDDRFIEGAADALVEMGQQDELFELLRNEAQTSQEVDDYIRLGRFAARVGDADEAEKALLFAAKLDGGVTIDPQLELAEFYESVGDDQRRLERLRMALFIEPDNEIVQEQIRQMGEVPGPSYAIVPTERD